MEEFARLFFQLDLTNKTNDKVSLIEAYFRKAPFDDQLVALALFSDRKPKRQVSGRQLSSWCVDLTAIPQWLFEESYQSVGDLAETISLLLPEPTTHSNESLFFWFKYITNLGTLSIELKRECILSVWSQLKKSQAFVFNKMITGGFRIGVSQQIVIKALAKIYSLEPSELTHKLMGKWSPFETTFQKLILENIDANQLSKPYPFCLAQTVENDILTNLSPIESQIEWKWDGIRGQFIFRQGEVFVWSRGEELITDKFPELRENVKDFSLDFVLDGEILAFKEGNPLPFQYLQTRIGRKNISSKMMKDVPVIFLAYDLLEYQRQDLRKRPLSERRKLLEKLITEINQPKLLISPIISFADIEELKELHKSSRQNKAEGFMIKSLNSLYESGRKKGNWYKWKVEPLSIDGVLIYAQKGHGRRAGLYTDYTFAIWNEGKLVPFAKAYSGLTDEEIKKADDFIKKNTLEKFGPVRTVKPALVFEIGFEGIQPSPRHKSGIALRFPRILRWRMDKKIEDANTMEDLRTLLNVYGQ
jgi:DNA ligase 1